MTWKLIRAPKTVMVAKEYATKFREISPIPNDRPLRPKRLKIYKALLEQGKFRPCAWATAYCIETSTLYRVNGNHTSTLLSTTDNLPEFFITLEEYQCDTLQDVADLYSTFDSKTQGRSADEIYNSFAGALPDLAEIPRRTIANVIQGISWYLYRDQTWAKSAADRAEVIFDHPAFVKWFANLFKATGHNKYTDMTKSSRHLQRQAIVAAMYGMWGVDPEDAEEFWTAVRDETGTSPDDPDRRLAKYLLVVKTSSAHLRGKNSTNREMFVKCIHAWNAWRTNTPTRLTYHPDREIPDIR